jgi:superfamily II DNA or RNA helicase
MELRPYQAAAIAAVRDVMRQGKRRVILYSPTGSGKTEMAIEIIRAAEAKGKRVLFVCARINLVLQSSRRLERSGIRHGIVQGKNTQWTMSQVLVCSVQTLASRGIPEKVDLLIIDEAHGATSEMYRNLILSTNVPCIGLTATPFTKGLGKVYPDLGGALFEEIVPAATITNLIDLNFLVDVDIYAPSEPDLKGVKIVAGDYHEGQLGERVDRKELIGDIVEQWKRLAGGVRTVCFATNIAHSQHIVEQFNAAGIAAEHMDCYTEDDERQQILWRLESGETRVISNVSILAEGWDCPMVECMILARPTRSLNRYIQMVGRALRPAPGKDKAIMLDHSGSCRRLGFPTDDLPLVLCDGTAPKPTASEEQAKIEALPHACPQCHFMKPPKVVKCPQCGHEWKKPSEVVTIKGTLEKLRKSTPEEKQYVYSQLYAKQQEKHYSPGWTAHKYKEWFGVWPRGMENVGAPMTDEIRKFLLSQQIRYSHRRDQHV